MNKIVTVEKKMLSLSVKFTTFIDMFISLHFKANQSHFEQKKTERVK